MSSFISYSGYLDIMNTNFKNSSAVINYQLNLHYSHEPCRKLNKYKQLKNKRIRYGYAY